MRGWWIKIPRLINLHTSTKTRHPPKYDLWPYKRQNTGGSITKSNRCVHFINIHLHTKCERNPSRNAAVKLHTKMWRSGGNGGVMLLNPKYPPRTSSARGYNEYLMDFFLCLYKNKIWWILTAAAAEGSWQQWEPRKPWMCQVSWMLGLLSW